MSSFARNATDILSAAEGALEQNNIFGVRTLRHFDFREDRPSESFPMNRRKKDLKSPAALIMGCDGEGTSVDLRHQLPQVLKEVSELRMMLLQEQEARSALLLSLGQRWKEEVVVECRSADLDLRRILSELEKCMEENAKIISGKVQLMQQQLEDAKRHSLVYSHSRLDGEERLREDLEELKNKFHTVSNLASNASLECVQILEREKCSIDQRLDRELFRYSEMRRADEREMTSTKILLKDTALQLKNTIRSEVKDQWHNTAVALEKNLWTHIETVHAELKSCRNSEKELESKVSSMEYTHESELRGLSNALKERISALESAESCTSSLVDRSHRKCDTALETVTKLEAQFEIIRESANTSSEVSKKVVERVQHIEFALSDRDSRMAKLESHLKAVSTAESLKGDIEACRRQMGSVESHVDALRSCTERQEIIQKRITSQIDKLAGEEVRASQEAKTMKEEIEGLKDSASASALRVRELEVSLEKTQQCCTRQAQWNERLEKRVDAFDTQQRSFAGDFDLIRREIHEVQNALGRRIDNVSERTAQSEATITPTKAELERLENRLAKLELTHVSLERNILSLQSHEDLFKEEFSGMSTKSAQNEDYVKGRVDTLEKKMESLSNIFGGQNSNFSKLESKLQDHKCNTEKLITEKISDVDERVEDRVKDIRHFFSLQLSEMSRKVAQEFREDMSVLEGSVHTTQDAVERIVASSSTASVAREKSINISLNEIQKLKNTVQERECLLNGAIDEVKAAQSNFNAILRSVRNDFSQLQQSVQDVQGDLEHLSPIVSTHEQQLTGLRKSTRNFDNFINNYEKPQDTSLNSHIEALLQNVLSTSNQDPKLASVLQASQKFNARDGQTHSAFLSSKDAANPSLFSTTSLPVSYMNTPASTSAETIAPSPLTTCAGAAIFPSVTTLPSSPRDGREKILLSPSEDSPISENCDDIQLLTSLQKEGTSKPAVKANVSHSLENLGEPNISKGAHTPVVEDGRKTAVDNSEEEPVHPSGISGKWANRKGFFSQTTVSDEEGSADERESSAIATESSLGNEGLKYPKTNVEENESNEIVTPSSRGVGERSVENSPPKTLQSLIETASNSGRSKSARSRSVLDQSHTSEERAAWDDWDSTSSESLEEDLTQNRADFAEAHEYFVQASPLVSPSSRSVAEESCDAQSSEGKRERDDDIYRNASHLETVSARDKGHEKDDPTFLHTAIDTEESHSSDANEYASERQYTSSLIKKPSLSFPAASNSVGEEVQRFPQGVAKHEEEAEPKSDVAVDTTIVRSKRFLAHSLGNAGTEVMSENIFGSSDCLLPDLDTEVEKGPTSHPSKEIDHRFPYSGIISDENEPDASGLGWVSEEEKNAKDKHQPSKNYSSFDSSSDDDDDA